jgi:hypothetical protein
VAGGAAVLVDPADPAAIADGLARVLDDPALRAELVAKGLVRGPQFDWDTTGRLTAGVIRSLVDAPRPVRGPLRAPARALVRATARLGAVVTERVAKGFDKK